MVNISSEYQAAHFPTLGVTALEVVSRKVVVHGFVCGSQDPTVTHYVKFYNTPVIVTQTATPTFIVCVPPDDVIALSIPGITFPLGLWLRASVEPADNGTGAPGTGDVTVAIFYS